MRFQISLIILLTLGLLIIKYLNITSLWVLIAMLIISVFLLMSAAISLYLPFASIIYLNLNVQGLIGWSCIVYLIYLTFAFVFMNLYTILGSLFLLLSLICIFFIESQFKNINIKDFFNKNSDEETKHFRELLLISFSLIFFLVAFILLFSPYVNQYIQYLGGTSNNGELINNSSTAVIITTTLGLAFFTPIFSHILSTMKRDKKIEKN